jgi:hypothetical protein
MRLAASVAVVGWGSAEAGIGMSAMPPAATRATRTRRPEGRRAALMSELAMFGGRPFFHGRLPS